MINILETVVDQYYAYKDYVLGGIWVVFLFVLIAGICLLKEDKRYYINKLLQNVFYVVILVGVGELLYLVGVTPSIEYTYFNVAIFAIVVGIIILYGIYQMIMFKKIVIPMLQICKYLQYTIFFELFLLAVTYHLEFIEWVVGTNAIIMFKLITTLIEISRNRPEEKISKKSGHPNSELYFIRERQMEKFVKVLEELKEEPYAIMISGEWGGKKQFRKSIGEKIK